MVHEALQESIAYIRSVTSLRPRVGLILGSGLGNFMNSTQIESRLPYSEIPHFKSPTEECVEGFLSLGRVGEVPIAVLQGRAHYYQGYSMDRVVFPTRTLAMLGIETLILTNAAGGLDPELMTGDFLVLKDHINLMGDNPLKGPNLKNLGPRFPDMSEPYDLKLVKQMTDLLKNKGIRHRTGVYAGVSGPTFETPAEVNYLRIIGAHAVGMSTVPEVIAANHLGLRVAALSCITNLATGMTGHKLSQQEISSTMQTLERPFSDFMADFICYLGKN